MKNENEKLDGPTIKAIRLNLGLTQREFASALNSEQARISIWEHGRHAPHKINRAAILSLWRKFRGKTPLPRRSLPSLKKFRVKGPVYVGTK